MLTKEQQREWGCWLPVAALAPTTGRCAVRSDVVLAVEAEMAALRQQRDALVSAAKAARDMILTDRTALADGAMRGDGTFDDDSAAALADYDAVIAQIDAAVGGAE